MLHEGTTRGIHTPSRLPLSILTLTCWRGRAQICSTFIRDEDGAPKRPLTLKVTLLDPVLMLPQDDQDADSKALFLQGLVMANYVRSPRYEKAFQPQQQPVSLGVSGTGRKEAAAAEARDTSLQVRVHEEDALLLCSCKEHVLAAVVVVAVNALTVHA